MKATAARWIAGLGAVALACVMLTAPHTEVTEASWVDAEHASASFESLTVPAPVGVTCTATGTLGVLPVMTLDWQLPAGYTLSDIEVAEFNADGLLMGLIDFLLSVDNTESLGDGNYRTTLRLGLLGGLIGGGKTIAFRVIGPGTWRSDWLVARGTWSPLGLTNTCVIGTAPSGD